MWKGTLWWLIHPWNAWISHNSQDKSPLDHLSQLEWCRTCNLNAVCLSQTGSWHPLMEPFIPAWPKWFGRPDKLWHSLGDLSSKWPPPHIALIRSDTEENKNKRWVSEPFPSFCLLSFPLALKFSPPTEKVIVLEIVSKAFFIFFPCEFSECLKFL